jgi:hypothetical protein
MEAFIRKANRNFFYSYNMIFDQNISSHAKVIYIFLCRCADADGQSFPSRSYIASKCSVSKSSVIRAMRELVDLGLILKEPQFDFTNTGVKYQTSNLYTIYDEPNFGKGSNTHTDTGVQQKPPISKGLKKPKVSHRQGVVSHRHAPCINMTPPLYQYDTLSTTHLSTTHLSGGGASPPSPPSPPQDKKMPYGEHGNVKLTSTEFEDLCTKYGVDVVNDYVDRIDTHINATARKYGNHASLVKKWITEDRRKASASVSQSKQKTFKKFANFTQRKNDNATFEKLEREAYIMKELETKKTEGET